MASKGRVPRQRPVRRLDRLVVAAVLAVAGLVVPEGLGPVRAAPAGDERSAAAGEVGPAQPLLVRDGLDDAVARWVADDAARSVWVAVARLGFGDHPVAVAAAADPDLADPDVAEPYGALSVTKTFTGALVLREAVAGRIQLDAPVPDLPGLPKLRGEAITPRMLLGHTAGVVNYTSAVGYDASAQVSPTDVVAMSLRSPRRHAPGARAIYTNTAYHWLGLLLEHVTGRRYDELVDEVAAQVGLRSTYVDPSWRPGWVGFASGGVRSTVEDVARWGAALLTPGRVLPPDATALLTTVGSHGVSHGLWPLCPCRSRTDGSRAPRAIGQVVADGGLLLLPDHGTVLAVHADAPLADPGGVLAELAELALAVPGIGARPARGAQP